MKVDRREIAAMLAPGALLAASGLVLGGAIAATLDTAERAALAAMLEPRAALLLLGWLLLSGALGWLARGAYLRWVAASARLAEQARVRHGMELLWVAMDARMDELYAGEYAWRGGAWHAVCAPALWTLPALLARWREAPPAALGGSALAAFGERLVAGGALRLPEFSDDRAEALARLARAAWTHGEGIDAAEALPLYLRDKVALTTAERAAAAAA